MSNIVQTSVEVQDRDGVLVVDSRLIAERLGIEHASFLKTIETHKASIEEAFGLVRFEIVPDKLGRMNTPVRYALLTEEQATTLMTLSPLFETEMNVARFKRETVKGGVR